MEFFAVWLLAAAYCLWRLRVMAAKRLPANQKITSMVYILLIGVIGLVSRVLPLGQSRTVSIIVLVGGAVIASTISFKLNRKYEAWLKEQED